MSQTTQPLQAADVVGHADELEALVRVLSEAGLFKRQSPQLRNVLDGLDRGRRAAAKSELLAAKSALLEASTTLDEAVHAHYWWWRLIYIHRGFLFLYLVAFLLLVLNVASGYLDWVAVKFWQVPTAALVFGAAGAILRSLYFLYQQVARRIFRAQFALAHLVSPLIGALLGMFTFLLVKGGLLVLQEGQTGNLEDATGPMALCFLAGFSWEWLLGWIKDFVERGRQATGTPAATPGEVASPEPPADAPPEEDLANDVDEADDVEKAIGIARQEAAARGEEIADSFVEEVAATERRLRELDPSQRLQALETLARLGVLRREGGGMLLDSVHQERRSCRFQGFRGQGHPRSKRLCRKTCQG